MEHLSVNIELVRKKLRQIGEYLAQLHPYSQIPFKDYAEDYNKKYVVERIIILLVDNASDIGTHLLIKLTNKPPTNYYESLFRLGEVNVLPQNFAREIAKSTGLRNRLVHEYERVDDVAVHASIKGILKRYRRFVELIELFLAKMEKSRK